MQDVAIRHRIFYSVWSEIILILECLVAFRQSEQAASLRPHVSERNKPTKIWVGWKQNELSLGSWLPMSAWLREKINDSRMIVRTEMPQHLSSSAKQNCSYANDESFVVLFDSVPGHHLRHTLTAPHLILPNEFRSPGRAVLHSRLIEVAHVTLNEALFVLRSPCLNNALPEFCSIRHRYLPTGELATLGLWLINSSTF